ADNPDVLSAGRRQGFAVQLGHVTVDAADVCAIHRGKGAGGQNPHGGRPVGPRLFAFTDDPLVSGCPHDDRADIRYEPVVVVLEAFEAELEQPIEVVVVVGDEAVDGGSDVILNLA